METFLNKAAQYLNSSRGEYESAEHKRLAEMVHDYKPTMSVVSIPEQSDLGKEFAYAIIDEPAGVEPYITRYLTRAMVADPASIMEWLFNGDLIKHRPKDIFERIQNRETAEKLVRMKAELEAQEARVDLGSFFFSGGRDKLHTIRHNGKKFDRS